MAKKKAKTASLKDIVKGKFLVEDGSIQNWRFLIFLVIIAFLSITSSHWIDKKVMLIDDLNTEVEDLKSQNADKHKELMQLQLEINILQKLAPAGIKNSEIQPYLLVEEVYDN